MAICLQDPDTCRQCGGKSGVLRSLSAKGLRRRRRECLECGHRWTTYETRLNPRRISIRPTTEAPDNSRPAR